MLSGVILRSSFLYMSFSGDNAPVCQSQGNEFICQTTDATSVTCDKDKCPLHGPPMAPIMDPQPIGQVMIGGWDGDTLADVELFPRPHLDTCSIPNLPQPRKDHSLSLLSGGRLVVCGGTDGSQRTLPMSLEYIDSCISWIAGNTSWTHFYNMSRARSDHTAWVPPSLPNSIVLLGNSWVSEERQTAEIVPDGTTFLLEHNGYGACGIPDGDTILLTGGNDHFPDGNFVTRYGISGFVEELPQLPENRWHHACAALPTTGAFIVAGGNHYNGTDNSLSSVLTLLPGATLWTLLASLPRALVDARASIVGGSLRVNGGLTLGLYRSEVLQYHPEPWDRWVVVGDLRRKRHGHAALSIGTQELPCFSECPLLPPSPGRLCVAPAGTQDCQYETDHCCCGHCLESFTLSCVPDSTTGAGIWKMSTICLADGCGSEGVVSSPNYPNDYPDNLEKTEMIQVEKGLVISLTFSEFDIEPESTCDYDHLTITEGDGTTLMEKSCGSSSEGNIVIGGQSSSLPAAIKSTTNIVSLVFSTDNQFARSGWRVKWSAVTPAVSCGNHQAESCALCPQGSGGWNGANWCNGDCVWINGQCKPETATTLTTTTTTTTMTTATTTSTTGLPTEGVVTSPKYPGKYPNNLQRTKTIRGAPGTVLVLEFTAFKVQSHPSCKFDFLKIRDVDGTILMGKTCGSSLPAKIISKTNIVKLDFKTNRKVRKTGWRVIWRAVTIGCENDEKYIKR